MCVRRDVGAALRQGRLGMGEGPRQGLHRARAEARADAEAGRVKVFMRGADGRTVDVTAKLGSGMPTRPFDGSSQVVKVSQAWLAARRRLGLRDPRVSAPSAQAAPPWGKRR